MRIQESRASLGEIWKSRASLWGNTGGQLWDLGRFRCGSHQSQSRSHCQAEPTNRITPDTAFRIMYIMFKLLQGWLARLLPSPRLLRWHGA
ncbi:MAG: hypothetical protein E2597_07285 [Stenotrophomonas sp.]|nr:hypothetical protein [Stenotrophomonas sp.]